MADTRVRIIPKMELHAMGLPHGRLYQEQIAIKTAASELSGMLVDELTPRGGSNYYAMPKRRRREKVGFVVTVTQISKRYVYAHV